MIRDLLVQRGETIVLLTFRLGERMYGGDYLLTEIDDKQFKLADHDRLRKNEIVVRSKNGSLDYDTLCGPTEVIVSEDKYTYTAYLYFEKNILILVPSD